MPHTPTNESAGESERTTLATELRAAARQHSRLDVLRWIATRKPQRWPTWIDCPARAAPPQQAASEQLLCTVINHSTILLQFDGWNVLTDPIWSRRCSPVQFAGPKRVHAPAVAFDALPPIDLVLLSHDHYDHCDRLTIRQLCHRSRATTTFVTGQGVGRLLHRWGAEHVIECDWWQQFEVERRRSSSTRSLQGHFLPVQHFTGRGLTDRNRSTPGAFALERTGTGTSEPRCALYGADTGYHPQLFRSWREALPPIELALLPIGAYLPRWFMGPVHMDPSDAVRAHQELSAKQSIGVHWGTFQLTDEARDEPATELTAALLAAGVDPDTFRTLPFGTVTDLSQSQK